MNECMHAYEGMNVCIRKSLGKYCNISNIKYKNMTER